MGRPFSQDLRRRIGAAVEGGMSRNAAEVSVSCVVKLMQRFQRTGSRSSSEPFALRDRRGERICLSRAALQNQRGLAGHGGRQPHSWPVPPYRDGTWRPGCR